MSQNTDTFLKLRAIIIDQTGVKEEDVTLTSRLIEDLRFTRTDLYEIGMFVEEELGIETGNAVWMGRRTVQQLMDYIEQRLAAI